jgi:hypothetical protein
MMGASKEVQLVSMESVPARDGEFEGQEDDRDPEHGTGRERREGGTPGTD